VDNFFIVEWFSWKPMRSNSKAVAMVNKLLKKLGFWTSLQAPRLGGGEMTNIEQRLNLFHFASQPMAYGVPGDYVELGCNEGQSSALIQRVIDLHDPTRRLHVYDSFEGLPKIRQEDGGDKSVFWEGQMKTSRDVLEANFKRYKLKLPEIHVGWFDKTLPTQLPEKIAFAYLDGDLYDSIMVSLQYVYPKMSKGAVCVIDDYADPSIWPEAWNLLPGVKAACDEFFKDKPEKVNFIYSAEMSHGFFRKL
jgi:O-methyltransferase